MSESDYSDSQDLSLSVSSMMESKNSDSESIFDSSETESLTFVPQPNKKDQTTTSLRTSRIDVEGPPVNANDPILVDDDIDSVPEVDRDSFENPTQRARFPVEQLVDSNSSKKEDMIRVNKVGHRNVGKKLQSVGSQIALFGQCVDHDVGNMEKELRDRGMKNKELSEKLALIEIEVKKTEKIEADLEASEKKVADLLLEKKGKR
ncbi:hypothetical protein SESBI_14160 [Sesbania bispinosa]|nr:hypothetical protein SESBI_14160 [Sesbania bispinosa]